MFYWEVVTEKEGFIGREALAFTWLALSLTRAPGLSFPIGWCEGTHRCKHDLEMVPLCPKNLGSNQVD